MDSLPTMPSALPDDALRQILDNTTAVVYIKDRQGRFLYVNRHFLRVFGLREDQVVGRLIEDVFPAEVAAAFRENDLRVQESGGAMRFEETAGERDGTHHYISHKFPLFDGHGDIRAVCGISTDITALKRAEELLCNVALGVAGAIGDNVFEALVRHLATTLAVEFAFVGELVPGPRRLVRSLAVCMDGRISEVLEYDPDDTPCRDVVGRSFNYIAEDVRSLYPGNSMLSEYGFTGYAGYPLTGSDGQPLGVIAVLSRQRLPEQSRVEAVLKIFAVRAAAELERQRAEAIRRQSELSYRAIFDASEDCIFVHDLDSGAIVDVNPRACRDYGYAREEFLRLDPSKRDSGVPLYTAEGATDWIEQPRRGDPVRTEWQRRNKDGSLHWDEVVLKRATIGGVERILAFTRDITERKAAEAAQRASEERYHTIFNASVDGFALCTADGRVMDANPAFCRLFGSTRDELLAAESFQFVHPDSKTHCWQFFEAASAGESLQSEAHARRKDGSLFDAEVHGVPVHYGNEPHLLLIMRDITERKQAETARAQLEAQLRQAQKMEAIGQLAGGIAHDFNNILTSIMGYVVLVMEKMQARGEPRLVSYLENAHQSGLRARDLIQQLLTFSRGQRGEPRPLALAPRVAEAVKLLGASLPSSVELKIELDPTLPRVMLDPVQLEQILMNLCINARDAMDGRGSLRVALSQRAHHDAVCASCHQAVAGHYVELTVIDDGPGIAPAVAERMFEPFFSTKEVGRGSGMGLAMVHGIVHEHGGHVVVESAAEGTTFRILLRPHEHGPHEAGEHAALPAVDAIGSHAGLHGRVMVVDDETAVGGFMRDLLEEWGLTVTLFDNAVAARDHFARDPRACDVVVLDQTMPGLSGLELAQDMLLLRPDLPVILYTGYREALTDAQVCAVGIRALVRKPVDAAAFHNLLAGILPPAPAR